MSETLWCLGCDWQGSPDELESSPNDPDDRDYSYCPDCGSKEDFETLWEEGEGPEEDE